jgi:hypothetical protein
MIATGQCPDAYVFEARMWKDGNPYEVRPSNALFAVAAATRPFTEEPLPFSGLRHSTLAHRQTGTSGAPLPLHQTVCRQSRSCDRPAGQRAHGLNQHAELLASAKFIPPFRLSVSITTSVVLNQGRLSGLTSNARGVEPQNRFGPSLSPEELLEPRD